MTNSTAPRIRLPAALALVLVALGLAGPDPAAADRGRGGDDDRNEIRTAGTCGRGAESKLRLKQDDGDIEVEFEVEHARPRRTWRVALVQEGRVVWRGRVRTRRHGSFELDRRIDDLPGADRVTARAGGPRGVICVASGILPG